MFLTGVLIRLFSAGTSVVWLVLIVAFLVIEGLVPGLVSIWFAVGALAAMISSFLGAPLWLQVIWFIIVSGASLAATRPLAKKYINSKIQPTNADRLIGTSCMITQEVNNARETGEAKVQGKTWSARSADDSIIFKPGTQAKIERIEGVKLIVSELFSK